MRTLRRLTLGTALATLLTAPAAWAARPLVSETADSLARGDCELETALASNRVRGQDNTGSLDTLVACGIGVGTQVSGAYNRSRNGGLTGQTVTLGGKTNLAEVQDGSIGWAIAYGASLDKAPGASWRHGGTRVFGVATKPLTDSLVAHFNLGWLRTESDRSNRTTWSLGVEGDGPVRWAADVFGDDRSRPWASVGLMWPLAEKLSANLEYAQQFERLRVRQWTLGLKFDF
ncbi:MAG: hypothetical protein QE285_09550 [Aquabacterium sp.]|nr:hypothetical protein [Aquabacterium sp.]